jgi:hypothetical protein
MDNFSALAKFIMVLGAVLLISGLVLYCFGKITPLGRLPGDISYHKGNFSFYFPLVTCLLLSLVLTLLLNLFRR